MHTLRRTPPTARGAADQPTRQGLPWIPAVLTLPGVRPFSGMRASP